MLLWGTAFVVGLVIEVGNAVTVNDCPSNVPRDKYLQVFQGICYRFVVSKHHYFWTAEADCKQNGGTLVLIKSVEVNSFILHELHSTYKETSDTWIGLSDVIKEGKFVWADGTKADYTNWGSGEGNGVYSQLEDCASIDPTTTHGVWRDSQCSGSLLFDTPKPYVCQYKPVTSPTSATSTTGAPSAQAPTTQAPSTQAPTTQAPTTQAPSHQSPKHPSPNDSGF